MGFGAIGIIGGSGLYHLEGVRQVREEKVDTPFGAPSAPFVCGTLKDRQVVFLSRHGQGHRLSPSEINYRANVFGMKILGVRWLISVSAVGSLREQIHPGDFVFPHQFIDWTRRRESSFFGNGIVAHLNFADPVSQDLALHFGHYAQGQGVNVHRGGTYICIEGPQFSTRAESHLFRSFGADIIGMTNLPEAKLAREAGMAYVTMALATDYDCWHDTHEEVTVEQILAIMKKNIENAKSILSEAIGNFPEAGFPTYEGMLRHAILTDPGSISEALKRDLAPLIGPLLERSAEKGKKG